MLEGVNRAAGGGLVVAEVGEQRVDAHELEVSSSDVARRGDLQRQVKAGTGYIVVDLGPMAHHIHGHGPSSRAHGRSEAKQESQDSARRDPQTARGETADGQRGSQDLGETPARLDKAPPTA